MPKINEVLLKLEGFQYDTSPDLNMLYYHTRLRSNASNLCMIILPWGKYQYTHLSMGVAISPDIFLQKMNDLFHGLELIRAYIDELLILTKEYCTDHVQKLELTLNKLNKKGFKCNIEKSLFGKIEMEYLGF